MPRKVRLWILGLAIVLVVLAGWIAANQPGYRLASMPNPNGYDDFLRAANEIVGVPGNFASLTKEELESLIATNAEVLRLVRVGLGRTCSAPTDVLITNFPAVQSHWAVQKALAQLLIAEGYLAESEQRPDDAVKSYLDAVHFGTDVARGGMMINLLVGVACESMGLSRLVKLAPSLECDRQRAIATKLLELDRGRCDWNDIMRVERQFARYQARGKPMAWVVYWFQARRLNANGALKYNQMSARLRLLATELALRCYRSGHSNAPTSLTLLVPDYLAAVPLDPFTQQPLIYRGRGTNWLLYSVGVDGTDDGGKRAPNRAATAKRDLFYDSWW